MIVGGPVAGRPFKEQKNKRFVGLKMGGSKVPAARKTTKTVEIAKKFFISLKAYINGTRTQKLKSLGQKMKKWQAFQFSPIKKNPGRVFQIAAIPPRMLRFR